MISPNPIVKVLLVAVWVFAAADANLFSQNAGGLRGTVIYGFDHVAIRNVYILIHRDGETDKDVRTDKSGQYSIQLPPHIYDVLLSAKGFTPLCRKVEIKPDGMVVFDAAMEASVVGMQQ